MVMVRQGHTQQKRQTSLKTMKTQKMDAKVRLYLISVPLCTCTVTTPENVYIGHYFTDETIVDSSAGIAM